MPTETDRLGFIHDHLKNIATLSSAAIILLVTLADKFPSDKVTVSIALAGFVLSLLSSLISQAVLIAHYPIGDFEEKPEYQGNAIDKSIFITWSLFFISMLSLASSAYEAINA